MPKITSMRTPIVRSSSLVLVILSLAACQPPPGGNGGATASGDPLDASYRPPTDDSTDIVEVPDTGIDLGWGWDRSDGEPVRTICVEFDESAEPAQTRYMTMSEVSDSYELMRSMGMSAQASVKAMGFEASGKAAFAKNTNITGYSSNFVMNASVENGVRYAAPRDGSAVRLTTEARRLAGNDRDEFEHLCGDSFVSAVYSGAKLTAVITIETKSQKEKSTLSAKVSGKGWGAEFEGSMNQSSGSATENKSMSLSIFQTGGRGDSIPKDKDDLLAKLAILPAIAFDAPKDFHMAVTPYETLANWPTVSLLADENEFEQLASYWGAYNTLYDELQAVLDEPTAFAAPRYTQNQCLEISRGANPAGLTAAQVARIERVQDDVLDALQRLTDFAAFCATADEACEFPEEKFRDPYAYRAQLPLELPPTGTADADISISALADAHLASPAKRRCQMDKDDPQCMSNAGINAWTDKVGFELVKFDDIAARDALLATLDDKGLRLNPVDCSDARAIREKLFVAEPGYPALWYHPGIAACVKDPDSDACAALVPAPVDPDAPIA